VIIGECLADKEGVLKMKGRPGKGGVRIVGENFAVKQDAQNGQVVREVGGARSSKGGGTDAKVVGVGTRSKPTNWREGP